MFFKKNRKYFSAGVFSKIVILYAKRNKSGWQNEIFLSALLYQSFPRVPTLRLSLFDLADVLKKVLQSNIMKPLFSRELIFSGTNRRFFLFQLGIQEKGH